MEEFLAAPGDDEIARIDITGRDGTGKWRCYPGIRLKFLQPAHLGSGRRGTGGLELEVGLFFGVFLFADAGGLQETGPALGRELGKPEGGFGLVELSPGAIELLVEFRRIDLGQKLPGLDMGADVHQPALEIPVGARIDRRFDPRLDFSRQRQVGSGLARLRRDDGNGGNGELPRLGAQLGVLTKPRNETGHHAGHDQHRYDGHRKRKLDR